MKSDRKNGLKSPAPAEEFFRLPRAEFWIEELRNDTERELGDMILNEPEQHSQRFTLPVEDNSMESAGIRSGDFAVIQANSDYREGDILAVRLGEEILIRRYFRAGERIRLECDPVSRQTIIVEKKTPGFQILGRVIQVIREIE